MDRRKILMGAAGLGALAAGGAALWRPDAQGSLLPLGAVQAQTDASGGDASGDTPDVMEMTLGDADAPVTLIEYASFTCPHCATFHARVLPDLKANYIDEGLVHYIYREVYFDRFGLWAGMVARCGGPMRYFGIADLIYEQQSEWVQGAPAEVAENLRRIGRTAGLTNEELDACLTDQAMAEAMIANYEAHMEVHEIPGTPSLIVNGEMHSNMSYADLAGILDDAIAAAE
jgi:protein-disulfide isomerase